MAHTFDLMEKIKILMIDLKKSSRITSDLRSIFEAGEFRVRFCEPAEIRETRPSTLDTASCDEEDILILILPEIITDTERALIQAVGTKPGRMPIIAVTEDARTDDVVELFKLGITDFITPPVKANDVMPRIARLSEHVRKKSSLIGRMKETIGLRQMIGTSCIFTAELQKIPFIARCDSSVLLSGETGTGKEMFARAIHYLGPRAGRPFTAVNCGAIPPDLIENELFGHIKGAYTSAITSQTGLIEETDGGTLFLDEIDCLPLSAQVKLLRFLQEREYRQLGSPKTARADVRVIAATNTNIEKALESKTFRKDLFYRLNILPLRIPPLRDRREDIPLLAKHFVDHYCLQFGKSIQNLEPAAERKLLLHDWPGNVRELQNIIERAVVFASGPVLHSKDIMLAKTESAPSEEPFQQAKARLIIEFEKNYIHNLLIAHHGNITHAAKTAGKNRRAFWELIKKHEIDMGQFRFSG